MTKQETEFAELVLSKVEPNRELELPQVVHDPDGDCIEFLAVNEDFRAKRVNSLVTVYIGRESNEIVGSLIKGVNAVIKGILDDFPGFKVEIDGRRVRLQHIFTAKMWEAKYDDDKDDGTIEVYAKLRQLAEAKNAEVELCEV